MHVNYSQEEFIAPWLHHWFRFIVGKNLPCIDLTITFQRKRPYVGMTAGPNNDPNHLPKGFAIDRQANKRDRGTITYFFNWDVMAGCEEVVHEGRVLRPASPGAKGLGLRINPRPSEGFVHYLPCEITASTKLLKSVLRPNQTTLVDIVLRRVIRRGVFGLDQGTQQKSFKNTQPGDPIP